MSCLITEYARVPKEKKTAKKPKVVYQQLH